MPTLEEVKEQINALDNVDGPRVIKRKEINELPTILNEDEGIEKVVIGNYMYKVGIIVATHRRLVYVKKYRKDNITVKDFPYDIFTSIEIKKGKLFGKITLSTFDGPIKLEDMDKKEVSDLAEYIQRKIPSPEQQAILQRQWEITHQQQASVEQEQAIKQEESTSNNVLVQDKEIPEEQKKALKGINMAAGAGFFQALFLVLVVSIILVFDVSFLGLNSAAYIDAIILTLLAFGVYKKSRVCAVILFIFFLISQFFTLFNTQGLSGIPVAVVFAYFYIQGIRGTFSYHRQSKHIT